VRVETSTLAEWLKKLESKALKVKNDYNGMGWDTQTSCPELCPHINLEF
jgi:hypothetical protein